MSFVIINTSLIMPKYHQFCTFFLDHFFLGLEVENVQEVIRYQSITRVPLAPPAVRGLINLRSQIVPAVDLRQFLELDQDVTKIPVETQVDEDSEHLPLNVVVRTADEVISLLVDDVGEVLEISDDCFEKSPETLRGNARQLIRGAYKLADQLLLILDTDKVVELTVLKPTLRN